MFDLIGTHAQAMEKPKHFAVKKQFKQINQSLLQDESIPQMLSVT